MNIRVQKYVLTDTGFWIGLYSERDEHHAKSKLIKEKIKSSIILMPWPIYYEFLNTRFVKNKKWIEKLEEDLNTLIIIRLNDTPYRENALKKMMEFSLIGKQKISLVDMVIRLILMDENKKIDYFVTYNERDFSDVCKRRRIQINL